MPALGAEVQTAAFAPVGSPIVARVDEGPGGLQAAAEERVGRPADAHARGIGRGQDRRARHRAIVANGFSV